MQELIVPSPKDKLQSSSASGMSKGPHRSLFVKTMRPHKSGPASASCQVQTQYHNNYVNLELGSQFSIVTMLNNESKFKNRKNSLKF